MVTSCIVYFGRVIMRDTSPVALTVRDTQDFNQLLTAIQTGDISELMAAIRLIENENGSERLIDLINQSDEEGNFLIHHAVIVGNPLAVRCLVQHGAIIFR